MKMLRIISKKDGFRRAGIAHSGTQTYPLDRFTSEQVKSLKSESMLVVDEVDVPDPKPDDGKVVGKK